MNFDIWMYILAAVCVVTGILMVLGKAKFLSSFSWGNNKDKPKSDKYVKIDGIISIVSGVLVAIAGLLRQNGAEVISYVLLAVGLVGIVCGTIYTERKFRKEQ